MKILIVSTANLALLHAGGWDEMLMVAVGLVIAWLVITWTGRSRDDADEEDDEELDETSEVSRSSAEQEPEPVRRPTERRDDE